VIEKVLKNFQFDALNAMQMATLDAAGKHANVLLLSPTGSGKTLAFLLPIFSSLQVNSGGVQALVIVPSRELALQIEQVFKQMGTGFKVNCCYGGHSTRTEKNNLSHPPALLVGTPGRIAYHIRHESFDPGTVRTLVLDEFDKALEFGFKDDMSFIIESLSRLSRRILTSATDMEEIPDFAGMDRPIRLNYLNTEKPTTAGLKVKYLQAADNDKLQLLFSLICKLNDKLTLVFCNHKEAVDRISALLHNKGLPHGTFHGGMEQEDRERSLIKFRNGSHRLLVATDLASRGLDIPEISAVIHYQLPVTEEVFTHRNGRTARMHASGTAFLLLTAKEHLPEFVDPSIQQESLPKKDVLPDPTPWSTLYIAAGKKEKINKMDIVGLILQKGRIDKEDLGRIEVLDHTSYAAVKRGKIDGVLSLIRNEKIKNKKVKMDVSR
jgi:superfamily II DNA/RNA helicase